MLKLDAELVHFKVINLVKLSKVDEFVLWNSPYLRRYWIELKKKSALDSSIAIDLLRRITKRNKRPRSKLTAITSST